MSRHQTSIMARFDRNVLETDGCWLWQGAINNKGYGQLRQGRKGYTWLAHRLSWTLTYGEIPEGLCVLHTCDNPPCVNPDHLFLGTHKDNARDCLERGRRAKTYQPHTRHRKLTDGQVRAIRADSRRPVYIAVEHGISETHVYQIKARRRKALVPD